MTKGIVGEKVGMTQVFDEQGRYFPVTVVQAGPCYIVEKRVPEKDGYSAIVVGFGDARRVNSPMRGKFKKAGVEPRKKLVEFRVKNPEEYEVGQEIKADIFKKGERVDVTGVTKGKGFQGTIKRWGFHRGPKTHGSKSYRIPGSIGSTDAARVFKGQKMAGRMGGKRVTIQNLEIIDVDTQENLLLVKGAIPGPRRSLVTIRNAVKAD